LTRVARAATVHFQRGDETMARRRRMGVATGRQQGAIRLDHGLRRLRSRNDSEYLFSNPVNAERLNRAIDDVVSGRTVEMTMDELYARSGRGGET
jgi:hypothetical protein